MNKRVGKYHLAFVVSPLGNMSSKIWEMGDIIQQLFTSDNDLRPMFNNISTEEDIVGFLEYMK